MLTDIPGKPALGLLISLWLASGTVSLAQQSVSKAVDQPYSLEITPKLHSAGHSLYSGLFLNHNLNLEFNITLKYKQWGAFATKFADLIDSHSSVNLTTVGAFRNLNFGKTLRFTPYLGYFLAQKHSFMDSGSDLWAGLVVKASITERVWIENTTLVASLLHHANNPIAIANRTNVGVLVARFRLDSFVWYTHSFGDRLHFVGASLAVTSPELILSPSVSTKIQITVLQKITDEKPEGAYDRGMIVSLIVPINCTAKPVNNSGN